MIEKWMMVSGMRDREIISKHDSHMSLKQSREDVNDGDRDEDGEEVGRRMRGGNKL